MSRTVLITGGLGTLGMAQAELFASSGDHVMLLDRPEVVEAKRGSHDFECLSQDLDDLSGAQSTVASLCQAREVGVLINNAALIINRPFESFDLTEFDAQMRINTSAAFALVQAVAPQMKARRQGVIINFCSVTLNGRWDGYVPYVTTKGAMLGLTKSLARELGPYDVRVNAVSPGAVVSDAEQRVFGDRLAQYNDWVLENQSLKRRIQPADVATLVQFLCSPQAGVITGQNIAVDGGW
ncbi:MAG: SDR family oxidoreductase [Devosia sp.]